MSIALATESVRVETPDARVGAALRHLDLSSFGAAEDAPGQDLWRLERRYRFGRDRAWLDAAWPGIAGQAEALARRPDRQRLPVWETSWIWAGLNAAAYLARESGHPAEARRLAERAARLHRDLVADADNGLGYDERDFATVVWPTRALAPNHRWLAATFDDHWQKQVAATGRYRPRSGEPGREVAEAHGRLWMGERARALEVLDYFLSTQPAGRVAAEVALLTRDLFVFEENDTLVFAAGVPVAWLEPGRRVAVAGLETWWGRVGMTIASGQRGIETHLELPAGAPPFELRLAGYRAREDAAAQGARPTGRKSWLGYPLWQAAGRRVTIRLPRAQ